MQSLSEWVHNLGGMNLPVLQRSVEDMQGLKGKEDSVTARDLSPIVLRDPLMTLKVLRFSQSRLSRRQPTEVTTVEHAVMMHGLTSFFQEMRNLVPLEKQLAAQQAVLEGALRVIARAWHAATYARAFAGLRHDMDSDEVVIGALLHDLGELLLWYVAPADARQIDHMLSHQRGLRSAAAQRACLGFALADLQLALAREWKLPNLLQSLMDDQQANHPRVQTVALAVAVARHSALDWQDPALPDDYAKLQKLLNLPAEAVQRSVRQAALQAARSWRHTGVRPAATWLPLLPGEWTAELDAVEETARFAEDPSVMLPRVLHQLAEVNPTTGESHAIVALVFYALSAGLGMRRLWYGHVNAATVKLEAAQTLLLDPGLLPGELTCAMGSPHLFPRLMGKVQGVWFGSASREKLAPLLPQGLREKLGARDFFAMSVHIKGQPFGLFYADGGADRAPLDEQRYGAFKSLCVAAGQALERLAA